MKVDSQYYIRLTNAHDPCFRLFDVQFGKAQSFRKASIAKRIAPLSVVSFYAALEVNLEIVTADVFGTAFETTLKAALKNTLGMASNAAIPCNE